MHAMKKLTLFAAVLITLTLHADSCDIAVMPAATLLLPYFEVDVTSPPTVAHTTLFTVVNTTKVPQIARVTLWTDLGYPVVNFNLFLTGYDVQAINLYDVLGSRGVIASPDGTSSTTETGSRSLANNANPNFAPTAAADCTINPGVIPAPIVNDIRNALTKGFISGCGTERVGLTHEHAIGYATIDVVKTCGLSFPNTAAYYDDLLYDNVLTGDFQSLDPKAATGNYAAGNPLVHIRAFPEGGAAGAVVSTDLPYTFYDRYTPASSRTRDRRQPLPSVFSARFVQGGAGALNTNFQIWREGAGTNAVCGDYAKNLSSSTVTEIVRFDEHENATLFGCSLIGCFFLTLPETSSTATSSSIYPVMASGDVGGWMYLNLNDVSRTRPSQNWVVVQMSAEGRYSVAFDATMMANGCSPAPIGP